MSILNLSPNKDELLDAARLWHEQGYSVIPLRADKKPVGTSWKVAQTQQVRLSELQYLFKNEEAARLGVVCGYNQLYTFDFDQDKESKAQPFDLEDEYLNKFLAYMIEQDIRPVTQKTMGDGWHVPVRIHGMTPTPNEKLVRVPLLDGKGYHHPIETRGTGGYIAIYDLNLDPALIPEVPKETFHELLEFARSLENLPEAAPIRQPAPSGGTGKLREPIITLGYVGWFNVNTPLKDVLERNGYRYSGGRYMNPESASGNAGIHYDKDPETGLHYCYSHHSSDVLNDDMPHDAFDVMMILEHGGVRTSAIDYVKGLTGSNYLGSGQPEAKVAEGGGPVDVAQDEITPLEQAMIYINDYIKDQIPASINVDHFHDYLEGHNVWVNLAMTPKSERTKPLRLLRKFGITKVDYTEAIKNASESKDIARIYADVVFEHWEGTDQHYKLAQNGTWYKYEDGVYRERHQRDITGDMEKILEGRFSPKEVDLKNTRQKLERHPKINMGGQVKAHEGLNLGNGLLDMATFELIPHSPEHLSFAQTTATYDPEAACLKFDKFITRVCPDENERAALQEFAGYVLTPYAGLEKALYLKGRGGTGKGTFTSVLSSLLDAENSHGLAASISLSEVRDNSHSLGLLENKRLALIDEVPMSRTDLNGFKKLVGSDRMLVNPKNKEPYNVRLVSKVIISANTHIKTGEDGANNSFRRRLLFIEFDQMPRPEDYNPYIKNDLTTPEELSGVLLWALEGLKRLRANNNKFTTTNGNLARSHEEENNPTINFINDWLELAPEGQLLKDAITSKDMFDLWSIWCEGLPTDLTPPLLNTYSMSKTGGSGFKKGTIVSFKNQLKGALDFLGWDGVINKRDKGAMKWQGVKVKAEIINQLPPVIQEKVKGQ